MSVGYFHILILRVLHVIESIEGFSLENSLLTFNVHYTYTCTIHKVNLITNKIWKTSWGFFFGGGGALGLGGYIVICQKLTHSDELHACLCVCAIQQDVVIKKFLKD